MERLHEQHHLYLKELLGMFQRMSASDVQKVRYLVYL